MKLQDYFKLLGERATPWAEENRISPSVISRYLNGRGISAKNALRIQEATGGQVTVLELLYGQAVEQDAA